MFKWDRYVVADAALSSVCTHKDGGLSLFFSKYQYYYKWMPTALCTLKHFCIMSDYFTAWFCQWFSFIRLLLVIYNWTCLLQSLLYCKVKKKKNIDWAGRCDKININRTICSLIYSVIRAWLWFEPDVFVHVSLISHSSNEGYLYSITLGVIGGCQL